VVANIVSFQQFDLNLCYDFFGVPTFTTTKITCPNNAKYLQTNNYNVTGAGCTGSTSSTLKLSNSTAESNNGYCNLPSRIGGVAPVLATSGAAVFINYGYQDVYFPTSCLNKTTSYASAYAAAAASEPEVAGFLSATISGAFVKSKKKVIKSNANKL